MTDTQVPDTNIRSTWRYTQLDVFGSQRLLGNPLAVVHDADALSDAQMQSLARWTNLSETTFLLRPTAPEADYRLRIFTPKGELRFAGHPSLGSCQAWIDAGGQARHADFVVQQCAIGLVKLRREGADSLAFEAPALARSDVSTSEIDPVLAALGLSTQQVVSSQWLDNGTRWLGLLLDSAATVLAMEPDHSRLKRAPKLGVIGRYPKARPGSQISPSPDFEVRAFAASVGIPEDPVTGSLNASLAQWLMADGHAPTSYMAAQGRRLGCDGLVFLRQVGDALWVGGRVFNCITGHIQL